MSQEIKAVIIQRGGDVVGPSSATDGNLAVFDGTTGKKIKDGGTPSGGSGSFISTHVARVDTAGDDLTGTVGNLTKPFQTVSAAVAAMEALSIYDPYMIIVSGPSYLFSEDITTALTNLTFIGNGLYNSGAFNSLTFTTTAQDLYVAGINIIFGGITASNTGHQLIVDLRQDAAINGNITNSGSVDLYGPGVSGNSYATQTTVTGSGVRVDNFPSQPDTVNISTAGDVYAYLSLLNDVTANDVHMQDSRFKPGGTLAISGTTTYGDVLLGAWTRLSIIDLGIVTVSDAAINGRNNILIPYADGRLIKSVRFVPGGTKFDSPSRTTSFVTPNTGNGIGKGYAYLGDSASNSADTIGLIFSNNSTGIGGEPSASQILDCGPLIAGWDGETPYEPIGSWQPDTTYCEGDHILDADGHVQTTVTGGVSGSETPAFSTSGGTSPPDGTISDLFGAAWQDDGLLAPRITGQVHAIAEVIEGVSPMPPYPATLEFVSPPSSFVAGETMPDVTVIVKDQNGDPYTFAAMFVELHVFGVGVFTGFGAVSTDQTTGIATFSGISTTDPGTYVFRARTQPVLSTDPIYSPPFDVTAP